MYSWYIEHNLNLKPFSTVLLISLNIQINYIKVSKYKSF